MFDVILRGGTVVDGTGNAAFPADIAICKDQIAAIGQLEHAAAADTINLNNCIVAPGFIDVHNHSDGWMLKSPAQPSKTLQGFTTEVLNLDGIGYAPVDDRTWRDWFFYLRALDGLRLDEYAGWKSLKDFMEEVESNAYQNAATHIPYANVRSLYCGFGPSPPDGNQQRQIADQIRQGMEAGAVGLSTGLDYIAQCFSSTEELTDACRVVSEFGGLYATHVRYKLGLIPALNEALQIARNSGVALHISHLKQIKGSSADEIFEWLDNAAREVPLSFDVYPYMPGSTMLNYLLPYDVWEEGPLAAMARLNDPDVRSRFADNLKNYKLNLDSIRIAWLPGRENLHLQGLLLSEYVAMTGLSASDALLNLLIEERMAVLCVYIEGDDRLIEPFLQHDLYMMGSDGILTEDGHIHPRQFGSAARLLSLVRDRNLMSIEQAVWKLSGHAASKFGLTNRGVIREGAMADLVVFDQKEIKDTATYDDPQQPAIGVQHVFVNGTAIVSNGKVVSADQLTDRPGRFLRYKL